MLGTARADPSELDFEQSTGSAVKEWALQTSLYTTHFDPDPDHVNDQNLVGIEAHLAGDWLGGVAVFDNSFGQSSQLVYAGKIWPLLGSQHWYAKLTGGLVHGYKEPYEDKIPLNGLGVAPVVIPALGFRYGYFVAEANLGGLAVVMVTAGVRF
jgi:hypothetical protein